MKKIYILLCVLLIPLNSHACKPCSSDPESQIYASSAISNLVLIGTLSEPINYKMKDFWHLRPEDPKIKISYKIKISILLKGKLESKEITVKSMNQFCRGSPFLPDYSKEYIFFVSENNGSFFPGTGNCGIEAVEYVEYDKDRKFVKIGNATMSLVEFKQKYFQN